MKNIRFSSILIAFIHTAIWLIILHLEFNLLGLFESVLLLFEGERFIDEAFILIPSFVILFYWNSQFLMTNYLKRKTWWRYVLGLLLSYLILVFLGYFIVEFLFDSGYHFNFDDPIGFYDQSLLLHLIVVGISTSLGIYKIAMKSTKQKEEAEEMQKEAEMKYLNAQINPHFLYNTLNGIYAQALEENAEKTTELILQLSEIMRFPLKNVSEETILLSDEIAFIEKFITLQHLRLGEDYPLTFNKTLDTSKFRIIPFLLIPIVENAFKYGVSQREKAPITFHLKLEGNVLVFTAKNKIITSKVVPSHLIGIKNLKRRLSLKYGDSYSLKISTVEDMYMVELKVG